MRQPNKKGSSLRACGSRQAKHPYCPRREVCVKLATGRLAGWSRCVKRGEIGAKDTIVSLQQQRPAGRQPDTESWELGPGDVGINRYTCSRMQQAHIDKTLTCGSNKPMWHQNVLGWLTRPSTPFKRLLVVWQMGLGKTQGMLHMLDNYFADSRPKLVLLPNPALIDNLYTDLVRWDSKYKHWLLGEGQRLQKLQDSRSMSTIQKASDHCRRKPQAMACNHSKAHNFKSGDLKWCARSPREGERVS